MNGCIYGIFFGILNCFGKNSTVSDIFSTIVLGMYVLWHLYCSIAGLMYQPYFPCGAHDAQLFGIL